VVVGSSVALSTERAANAKTGVNEENLYEWAQGKLQQVNVLPGLPGEERAPAASATLGASKRLVRHAISDDGSRVFWTEAATVEVGGKKKAGHSHLYMRDMGSEQTVQLDSYQQGVVEGESHTPVFQAASAEGSRVFFLDEERLTKGSGAALGKPDLYECQIVEVQAGKPACDLSDLTSSYAGEAADVQGVVLGASEDGTLVYFLANGVLSGEAQAAGATAGHCGSAAARHPGATCNLYLERYDGESGHEGWQEPRFIARLSSEDAPDWEGPNTEEGGISDLGEVTSRVSPDGRYLAFMSDRPLTSFQGHPYDNRATSPGANDAPAEEVYLYDSSTGRLVCASCDPSGAGPVGVFDPPAASDEGPEGEGLLVDRPKVWEGRWLAGSVPGWTALERERALYQSRYLSDSGRLFFDSPEALVRVDTNGKEDVYEYEPQGVPRGAHQCTSSSVTFSVRSEGCVGLISSGTSTSESAFLDASETGGEGEHGEELEEGAGDVFFVTAAKLALKDSDSSFDVYDAHECMSGSPCILAQESSPPVVCESAYACRPGSSSQGMSGSPATGSASGSGNIVAQQKVLSSKTVAPPKPLTRAQKLAQALKACKKDKKKSTRASCEKQARKKYGPLKKKAKAKKSSSHRTPGQGGTR
jgi:hypothetical protein